MLHFLSNVASYQGIIVLDVRYGGYRTSSKAAPLQLENDMLMAQTMVDHPHLRAGGLLPFERGCALFVQSPEEYEAKWAALPPL